ncbi:MAG TPA: alternative ribosome rescue aminoacyl-tRNA hydrolase ArfB [Williamwhitmania sp.]|nr:alternative ribosome rescue aminoacyl-tRNA hydrolase ArfB [Williamwhitmania sp.]
MLSSPSNEDFGSSQPVAVWLRDFSGELTYSASRSSGAGGQNVNKVNSKVELRFSITDSLLLSATEKEIMVKKLGGRVTAAGELLIVSQEDRSQLKNKEICTAKFYELLQQLFTPRKKRRPTKPSRASKEKRLDKKKVQSLKKVLRRKNDF